MNKDNILKKILTLFLISFSGLYIMLSTGYYESRERNKMIMTNEQIKRFEEDIKLGKEVDQNDYLKDGYVDYSNNLSRKMTKLSNGIETEFERALKFLFKEAGNMIEK